MECVACTVASPPNYGMDLRNLCESQNNVASDPISLLAPD